jgi:cell division protein ZapA (FtsZ GTPase activity inhibitor)
VPLGPTKPAANGALGKRVEDLENELRGLRQMLAERIRDLEEHAQKSARQQTMQFGELLKEERARNELLTRESIRLKIENRHLKQIGQRLNEKLKYFLNRTP